MCNEEEYMDYLEKTVNELAAEAKTREGFIREILSKKGANMEKLNLDYEAAQKIMQSEYVSKKTTSSRLAPVLFNINQKSLKKEV
jgi:hypothetical protein